MFQQLRVLKTFRSKRNCRPVAVIVILATLGGCSARMGEGAGVGAVVGAGLGLLVGAIGGRPAEGLAVGAAVGGAQGAYDGWKQEQDDVRTRQITAAIRDSAAERQPSADPSRRAREELTRFLGVWKVDGWLQEPGESRRTVSARVNANVEMNFFVELAFIDLKVSGYDGVIWGSSMLGFDERTGYTITTRFNTLPSPTRMTGTFDTAARTFTFSAPELRVKIQFLTPDRFITETILTGSGDEVTIESYQFTRT